jgi:hypothetical protein
MSLLRKKSARSDGDYRVVARNLSGHDTTNVTGLEDNTVYTFRFVAYGPGGQTNGYPATVTTQAGAPEAPARPSFYNVTRRSVTVRLPSLPYGATSLTLQQKNSWRDDWGFRDIARGLEGRAIVPVDGLSPGTSYSFRCVAVGPGGFIIGRTATVTTDAQVYNPGGGYPYPYPYPPTYPGGYPYPPNYPYPYPQDYPFPPAYPEPGTSGPVYPPNTLPDAPPYTPNFPDTPNDPTQPLPITPAAPLPGVPDKPVVGEVTLDSIILTSPPLPQGAISLTLQGKVANVAGAEFQDLINNLAGGVAGRIGETQPGTSYIFRYLAIGAAGSTPGAEVRVLVPRPGEVVPVTPVTPPLEAPGDVLTPLGGAPDKSGLTAPLFARTGARGALAAVPNLPAGHTLNALQIKTWEQGDEAFRDANLEELVQGENGQSVAIRGLEADGNYSVRWVADGPAGRIYGPTATLTTEPNAATPQAPEAPVVEGFATRGAGVTARVIAPPLPPGARYLRLQIRRADEVAAAFRDWQAADEGAVLELWDMAPQVAYVLRWVAIGEPNSTPVEGPEIAFTPGEALRRLPQPTIVAVGPSEIWVQPREVPPGATQLVLQIKPQDKPSAIWVPASLLPLTEGAPLRAGYLWPTTNYQLRWVATTEKGEVASREVAVATRAANPPSNPPTNPPDGR